MPRNPQATAAVAYHQSLVDYNKSIVNLYFPQGDPAQGRQYPLAEGQPAAYKQAYARAKAVPTASPRPICKRVRRPSPRMA
ncbi:MAG: hypothetical protein R3C12_11850 [Planctomycetaceae bacterium]